MLRKSKEVPSSNWITSVATSQCEQNFGAVTRQFGSGRCILDAYIILGFIFLQSQQFVFLTRFVVKNRCYDWHLFFNMIYDRLVTVLPAILENGRPLTVILTEKLTSNAIAGKNVLASLVIYSKLSVAVILTDTAINITVIIIMTVISKSYFFILLLLVVLNHCL